jgi:hypothetical protein
VTGFRKQEAAMETTDRVTRYAIVRVLSAQCLVTALAAAGLLAWRGVWIEALAAVYGGGIAAAAAAWFGHGLVNSASAATGAMHRALLGGAIQRFAFVATAFAAGMGLLALPPAPLLVAFGGCQLCFLLAATSPQYQ